MASRVSGAATAFSNVLQSVVTYVVVTAEVAKILAGGSVVLSMIVLANLTYERCCAENKTAVSMFSHSEYYRTLAYPEDYPYHVSIEHDEEYICSGALIGRKFVLTLASCVFRYIPHQRFTELAIIVNALEAPAYASYYYYPEAIIVHDKYNRMLPEHNVAVIRLNRNVILSDTVKYVNLPNQLTNIPMYSRMKVSGFPYYQPYTDDSARLRGSVMKAIDWESCQREYSTMFFGVFCALTDPHYPTCMGSIGSPGVYKEKILVALKLKAYNCDIGYPELFLDVTDYREFIEDAMYG